MATNYLTNPSFETDTNHNGLADGWLEEHSTATAATYTQVASGVAGGGLSQRMVYAGEATNTGTQKVEFYQATETGTFGPGDPCTFDIWLSGSVVNAYAAIVVEAHAGSTYLAEVNQVVALTSNAQLFRLTYPSLPAGTDSVVVVVQSPELTATSSVDITADLAEVTKQVLVPIVRRVNYATAPSFELGTTPPGGWTDANGAPVTVAYTYPTTDPKYGSRRLSWALTGVSSGTNNQAQLISATSPNGSFAEGDTATVSLQVDGSLAGCSLILRIQFMTAAGGSAGTADSTAVAVTGTPTRASFTAVAPATTAAARVLLRVTGLGTSDAYTLNMDGVLLESAATAGGYFDGDTPGYEWLGTAHASESREIFPTAPDTGGTSMAISAAQVTVSTAAVALNAAETDTVAGARLVVRNSHATDTLVLGPATVTAGTGYGLAAGGVLTVNLDSGDQLYAIRGASADITAHVLRIGV